MASAPADSRPGGDVVLITGASGFIGSALIKELAARYTVVGLDRPGPPDPVPPAAVVDFDLSSDEAVRSALEDVRTRYGRRIASIIHLAAYYDVSGEPNPLYEKVTVEGTRRLIDGLADFEVEQFVFASSMLVHKPTASPAERITEDSPIGPTWAYPESKIRTEALLRAHHDRIPVVFLRIAGVYSDDGRSPFLAEQIARIYEHQLTSHFYPGMLCAAQSFIHRDDLADAVLKLVDRRRELPAELPLLLGEPDPPSYEEIQDLVGQSLHGEGWTTLRIPKPIAKAGVIVQNEVLGVEQFIQPWMVDSSNDHYILDISRAEALLDWRPRHHLRDVLPRMVEALKADPQGWYKKNKLNEHLVAWSVKKTRSDASPHHHGHSGGEAAVAARPVHSAHEPAATHDSHAHAEETPGAAIGAAHGGHEGHMAMMERDERRARWAHYANIGLGLWLASSPLIYDAATSASVSDTVLSVTAERGLPSVEWRAAALGMSDLISGLLLAFFGLMSLSARSKWWAQWGAAFVGIWLLFAPLLFWSPSAAQYNNDLIVGGLAIAFSVLVPMMPGMSMAGMMDPKSVPPGWTYSPSTDAQRLPIAVLGILGLLISRYLTAYQLGHIDHVWEPFFAGSVSDPRNGTEEIITSDVSRAWPIPDAGLGGVSYMLEILMAVMGTRDRWRTMPWMVTFFGILVVPLGVVSVYFIIIQPIMIGTWSTLALIAALAMLVMVPFALDEVIAMAQFLRWSRCQKKPLLRTFFKGDAVDGGAEDQSDVLSSPRAFWQDTVRGLTLPWTLAASMALGVFLMLTRLALGAEGELANTHHVVGALAITVSIIATAEVARALRFANAALGVWLIVESLLSGQGLMLMGTGAAAGAALIVFSLPRGRRSGEHYASWDRYVM
jgi:nucleoside-diphosphate-sugar epimerase/uncharacterized membrane protein